MTQPEPMAKLTKAGSPDVAAAMDRLSYLPDGLIHTVMSFLPAPEVVRTCVLSWRWRSLWRSALDINIDDHDFGISMMTSDDDAREKWARFEDFATNLLLFRDNTSPVCEFRLHSRACNQRHVDRWILRGIKYCPSVLNISILQYPLIKLPPVAASNFCHLKKLHLRGVDLGSHFAGLLCLACPVMKDLKLKHCKFSGNCSQGITSPTLQKLVLKSRVNKTGYPLTITAPSLVYICLMYGCYRDGISLCKMDSLVGAKIYIIENTTLSQQNQRELLCSMYNVTNLELVQDFGVEVMLNEDSDELPIFRNMKTLGLYRCFCDKYELYDKVEALGSFLQRAPCLEKLILQYCMFYPDSECEIERKNITLHRQDGKTFQCQKLKLIEIIYDHDHDHQLLELCGALGRACRMPALKLSKSRCFGPGS